MDITTQIVETLQLIEFGGPKSPSLNAGVTMNFHPRTTECYQFLCAQFRTKDEQGIEGGAGGSRWIRFGNYTKDPEVTIFKPAGMP